MIIVGNPWHEILTTEAAVYNNDLILIKKTNRTNLNRRTTFHFIYKYELIPSLLFNLKEKECGKFPPNHNRNDFKEEYNFSYNCESSGLCDEN